MLLPYDIVLFDIKNYSRYSEVERSRIRDDMRQLISAYDFDGLSPRFMQTGDGYYIGVPSRPDNPAMFFRFISRLVEGLHEVNLRFALHSGDVEEVQDVDDKSIVIGQVTIELERILSSTRKGNVVLLSRRFYDTYIGGTLIREKAIDSHTRVLTHKRVTVRDKNDEKHEALLVSLLVDDAVYGTEDHAETGRGSRDKDNTTHDDFRKILEAAYQNCDVSKLSNVSVPNPKIYYSYLKIDLSPSSQEYYLFVRNDANKVRLIEYFFDKETVHTPLNICCNKKSSVQSINESWKSDFLSKLSAKSETVAAQSRFSYLDEYLWDRTIPKNLKQRGNFSLEKDFISPSYSLPQVREESSSQKPVPIENYLTNWTINGSLPICLIVGPGGVGKTTVIKDLCDKIQNNAGIKKTVYFVDGSVFARKIDSMDADSLLRVESIADLVSHYFLTIGDTHSPPLFLNEYVLHFAISSGNILVVIDGLDEIAAVLKDRFSVEAFLSDVISIDSVLSHSKILITARKYYFDSVLSTMETDIAENAAVIAVEGFTKSMAKDYFLKKFDQDDGKIDIALSLMGTFSRHSDRLYSPFVAYIVSDIINKQAHHISGTDISSLYLSQENEFEDIILNVCNREIERQALRCGIDDLLELFKEIVIEYQGRMPIGDFIDYVKDILPGTTEDRLRRYESFLANPLIGNENGFISFTFDFIQDHLITAFLSHAIVNNQFTFSLSRILARYCDGKKNDTLHRISDRIRLADDYRTAFKTYFDGVLSEVRKERQDAAHQTFLRKSVSTLLYIAMEVYSEDYSKDKQDRTRLLKELYGDSLDQLHIHGPFYPLDFRSCTVTRSTFHFFTNFFKSDFSVDTTRFIDTTVNLKIDAGISPNRDICEDLFDTTCRISEDVRHLMIASKSIEDHSYAAIKKDLKTLFNTFYDGGRMVTRKESHLSFQTTSSISSKSIYKELVRRGYLDTTGKRPPHNVSIDDEMAESTYQLVFNNHVDYKMGGLLDHLVQKFYR